MVEILTLVISVMGVIILPFIIMAFRAAIRWKGIEDKLGNVVDDLGGLIAQMKEDRKSTDRRLRWLEENIWRRHGNST